MKIISKNLLVWAMSFGLIITSCKKKDETDPSPSGGNNNGGGKTGMFHAKVNGVDYDPLNDSVGAIIINGGITLAVATHNGSYMGFSVDDTTKGTYTLNRSVSMYNSAFYTAFKGDPTYNSAYKDTTTGQVIITEIDRVNKTISGTFSCRLARPKSVTVFQYVEISEGTFTKVPYEGETPVTPNSTFSTDIDGQAFAPQTISGLRAMSILMISGTDGNKSVAINMPGTVAVGTYTIGKQTSNYSATYTPSLDAGTIPFMSESGTLTITKHDIDKKRIEGTFSFKAKEYLGTATVNFTNGKFALDYETMD